LPTGSPTANETFRQIPASEIEVAKNPSQFTGGVKPGYRFAVSVYDLLMNIMHRSTMGVLT